MVMTTTTVKRSPIVLIKNLIFIEFLFFVFYLLATFPDQYKFELFNKLLFSQFLSYQTFKIFFVSTIQFLLTVYVFLRWYYESYTVRPAMIAHQWGVLFRKNKTVPLNASMAITTTHGPIGKILHYGSIHIQNGPKDVSMVIADISRPHEFMRAIGRSVNPGGFRAVPNVPELLAMEEHDRLEFKASLRVDDKSGQKNRGLERAAMKTVAAFLNTKGGHLVLGVNDRREPVGLARDYRTLQRPDSDGFENHFTQLFNAMIGPGFRHFVKLSFHPIGDEEVCVVQVTASPRPAYLTFGNSEDFFVRTGNITTALKLSEVDVYKRSRWPDNA